MAVKIAGFVLIMSLDLENNYLRQGLILLPAYFLEGWIAAVALQLFMFGGGEGRSHFFSRREVPACVALYVLAKLGSTFFSHFAMLAQNSKDLADPQQGNSMIFVAGLGGIALAIWGFRFFWLYVPAGMGADLKEFLRRTQAFAFSFYLMGFWLLCFVPFAAALIVLSQFLSALMPGDPDHPALPFMMVMAAAQALAELCIILVSTFGFAHGVRGIMQGRPRA